MQGPINRHNPEVRATHKVRFYGIPCYWNDQSNHLWGANKLVEWLLDATTSIHQICCVLLGYDSFPLTIVKKYKEG